MAEVIAGIRIPDSKLAREATDLLREHGTPLLFAHSLSPARSRQRPIIACKSDDSSPSAIAARSSASASIVPPRSYQSTARSIRGLMGRLLDS